MRDFFWSHDVGIKLFLFLFVVVLVVNLGLLNKKIFLDTKENVQKIVEVVKKEAPAPPEAAKDECDEECQRIIEEKVSEAVSKLPKTETKTVVKEVVSAPSPKPTTTYIPIGAADSTQSTDWKTISSGGVWIDTAEYGASIIATWDASIKIANTSGKVFARLLDDTHSIGVAGSETSYNSDSFTNVVSGSLALWQGKNFYKVQIKSGDGSMVSYDSGRIKIVGQ